MAAVTPSPPSTSWSMTSSVRRKPVPTHGFAHEPYDLAELAKPLPSIPSPASPRLRKTPVSPVRVEFRDQWPQPSNASIETDHSVKPTVRPVGVFDRDLPPLPRTPEAPRPPPHSPAHDRGDESLAVPEMSLAVDSPREEHGKQLPFVQSSSQAYVLAATSDLSGMVSPDLDDVFSNPDSRTQDVNRHSRETDTSTSTSRLQASTESSATTSASSVSGANDACEPPEPSVVGSPECSVVDHRAQSVPPLQYHHQPFLHGSSKLASHQDPRTMSYPDLGESAAGISRHLTPNSYYGRRSSLPRPQSAYSAMSDFGPRGRSPGFYPGGSRMRAPSAHSRASPETRPSSYAELLNVPYPQPAPAPITFDNSQLRNAVGTNASLLSAQKTLEMYRQNVKKTNDASIQYSFAVFLIATAQDQGLNLEDSPRRKKSPKPNLDLDSPYMDNMAASPHELVYEARAILQKLSNNGYPFAQYYLADGYASGLFSKGKEDYNSAFSLFVLAAKHGHAESAYRAALCYEFGWGCRKDPAKAVQFLRTGASKRHPGAMTRLGKACLSGDLGEKRYREGIKWLKLATEAADAIYNAAPYHLGCLYETGYGDDIFQDESYTAELFTQAANLGHSEANFRMGDAYEHGRLNCPRDPALSVHFYTGAAEHGHAAAMMGLCAWYMVGAEPILEKDEEEAYEWARRSAELGFVKAQYAVGYFTEMGIGCRRDILEANVWYVKAADAGDDRAKQRLAAIRAAVSGGGAVDAGASHRGKLRRGHGEKDDKECVVM